MQGQAQFLHFSSVAKKRKEKKKEKKRQVAMWSADKKSSRGKDNKEFKTEK